MTEAPAKAAMIGGGVIGGGWAARFLLNGWDVAVFDPQDNAESSIRELLEDARAALPEITGVPLPTEGRLQMSASIADAVRDAFWVQESVPEVLDLKHTVFADIQAACTEKTIIASSTSGFRPSQLQERSGNPRQIVVAHPFNPVYLLPVVEVVAADGSDDATATRAANVLQSIGMKPVIVRKEIDAHVADRLLESVWREALWLIRDNVTTTEELDDIIRYGFGLRWAQMGLFETYRLAGGDDGMRHFLAHFGPSLKWPWTHLMDVPELDDELVEKIAAQSDEQSGQYTIRELRQHRDKNLVAILRALKTRNWGAGKLLNEYDHALSAEN